MRCLASDNFSGVHPEIFEALLRANDGHQPSYGNDPITHRAVQLFREIFGEPCEVFFVYNGTGANTLSLAALTRSFHAILCSEYAHIQVDESTAPEKFTGCKLIPLPAVQGKILPEHVVEKIHRIGDPHHPQAKVISISQLTEYGTVYTPEEVAALSAIARQHGLYLHMDGARICNAAVSLNLPLRSFTRDCGVDILSFGGTKNGMMFGEAVIIFNPELAEHFSFIRKQGMQLHSKMRFISAQFEALLRNDLWKRNATHANQMARLLASRLSQLPGISISQPVQGNGVFALFPPDIIPELQKEVFFYVWNEKRGEVRLMCSFDTSEEEIHQLVNKLKELITA
jgi:threonine aldolase